MILPNDVFMYLLQFLSFDSVRKLCQTCKTYHYYGTSPKYLTAWKSLMNYTYGCDHDFINYLTYVRYIKELDEVEKAMIYWYNDPELFSQVDLKNKFFALFLLKKKEARNYLPSVSNRYFIKFMNGNQLTLRELNMMLSIISKSGSIRGVEFMLNNGAILDPKHPKVICEAVRRNHIKMIKHLLFIRKAPPSRIAFYIACRDGHLDIIKCLFNANISVSLEYGIKQAAKYGQLEIVEYLMDRDVR